MSHAPAARSEHKDFGTLAPELEAMVRALGSAAAQFGLDKQLLELVKIRASQINGCAFCVQYHIMVAEGLKVPAAKLDLLVVWREAPVYSPRERAALAWTEALTLVAQGVSDEIRAHLFDAFVTNKPTGTGLGLALVAKIINDHGGAIEFESEPGRTTFRVMLPLQFSQAAP